ncbi:MAG: hypothetical protein HY791_31360 [Deltaproteobacteria bacterium]|nr:hypothetical protein [Deltaproteobacteria bacterium]
MSRRFRVDAARLSLQTLNDSFRTRAILSGRSLDQVDRFYEQLESQGCGPTEAILLKLVPDDVDAYVGLAINRGGRVLEFDISLAGPEFSTWSDLTETFNHEIPFLKKHKPWDLRVIGLQLLKDSMDPTEEEEEAQEQ